MARTTLYRFLDKDGTLLYVGVSLSALRRWQAHRFGKDWWDQVAATKLEHFPDRPSALIAEARAIATEEPRHNILDNPIPGEPTHRMLTVRMSEEAHQRFRVRAARAGKSMETLARELLLSAPIPSPTPAPQVRQVGVPPTPPLPNSALAAKRIRDENGNRI